ncbi:hypothetical protein [Plebeiibacterium marinum]|uniref:Uncharacterized protein n=1 Tax=Plebeiibacterium marinum TaxID=2992111 RepID=A0AAE3MCE2_9BACT|nr:hypothetical protein [Plebeiobacterium marinum]MCW3804957.1 hypothetical protein [Plebeiobacterium marinum]
MKKSNIKYRVLIILFFIAFQVLVYGIKPFYRFGYYNKTVTELTSDITKALLANNFQILGMYNPANSDSLKVIVFTCDELTSMATGIGDKTAFGSTMRIGIIGNGHGSSITMLNPDYFIKAFFNSKVNTEEVEFMTSKIDSMALDALSGFSESPVMYGHDMSVGELSDYRFLPTMARFSDVVKFEGFDEYLEAYTVVRQNIMNGAANLKLVYELSFEDKEIAVLGISFGSDVGLEKDILEMVGVECLPSLPIEILIQDNMVYILNPKYRIPLYCPELSSFKLLKIMGISSDIKGCVEDVAYSED